MSDAIRWYDANATDVTRRYESVTAESVHAWLIDLLPNPPAMILDVGAGSGRDAAWLATRGLDVVAVEPSAAMRAEGQRLHGSPTIRWIDDCLPGLDKVLRLGLSFDLILLSAVWMHVPPQDRARAFRKLVMLLKPGGSIVLTLRHGPAEMGRAIYTVSQADVERLAREHGAFVERANSGKDALGRDEVMWTEMAIRLPDDGSGALPLLRHIILNDDKSSTYKLALLRVLCRIADGAAGYARDAEGEHVAVPLGLVALYWIRLFKPLLAANLPQNPTNIGDDRFEFVQDGFRGLKSVSHLDLRIGTLFGDEQSVFLHAALRDACETITRMPATYLTYPNGAAVLPVKRYGRAPRPASLRLDEAYLSGFGEMRIPRHLWCALQRFDVWIEPALIAEWSRLIQFYAERQGRRIEEGATALAMTWSEPSRDVRIAKEQALRLIDAKPTQCVWSGRVLSAATIDIDHCIPWAAWPCDDLWNLLPADRQVNQKQKRDRLPSVELLRSAQDRILGWWREGYLQNGNRVLAERFMMEAKASLPMLNYESPELDDVFSALNVLQLRLKQDQQVPIWEV